MDMSLIGAVGSALTIAKEIGSAAIGVRDANKLALVVSQLTDQILQAQQSLFSHSTQLHALQEEKFELTRRLREAEEQLAKRKQYTAVEISDRTFVLRASDPEVALQPVTKGANSDQSFCQPCFSGGREVMLQKQTILGSVFLVCSVCKAEFSTGQTEPFSF